MIVVVVAEESAGAQALRLTAERGTTSPRCSPPVRPRPRPARRSRAERRAPPPWPPPADLGLDVLEPALVRDPTFGTWIADHDVDLLLNVHSLQIAHGEVVAAPHIGSFNLHPGPLPGYAGLNAPSWAIYEGETRHAVTLHWMSATVDAGAIAYEAWFDIGPTDTGLQVATTCVRQGVPLVGLARRRRPRGRPHPGDAAGPRGPPLVGPPPAWRASPWDLPARRIVDLVRASNYAPSRRPGGGRRPRWRAARSRSWGASLTGEPADAPPGTVGEARPRGGWWPPPTIAC